MAKTIVITGGAGFIGSHLSRFYLHKGFRVIVVDNLISGRLSNIEDLRNNENFSFVRHDVSNHISIAEDIDYILHFASPASPVDYLEYPIQTLKVGSLGTHNVLGLAKKKGARMMIASTSEIYGDPLVHPQTEDYWGNVNPIGPRGVYDEAKRFSEAMTMAYHNVHGVNTSIIRIFNTYGPQMRAVDGRAVPTFIKQARTNEDITVYGDGSQTRSFCYVDDLVRGIDLLLMSDVHQPVNMGNDKELSILGIAKVIIEMTNSKSKIVYKDLPLDDPKVRRPDISRAKKLLSWQPEVELSEGLTKTIEYFSQLS